MGSRLFDITVSLLCLILLLPICLIIAICIGIESKGPVIFKQKRVGKKERPYNMYKFRSMYIHEQAPEELGPIKHNHLLVTHVGYFLRRFKLDELPQLFNVLLGHMSLVGPRPCLFSKIETMSLAERRRFQILPGMTSWAEVNGNVELDWNEQLMLDLWYVDHKTFWLDMLILLKTVLVVLRGSVKNPDAISQAKNYYEKSTLL